MKSNKTKEFSSLLDFSGDDVLHTRLEFDKNNSLEKFSLNYSTLIREGSTQARKPVARYDSSHGFVHMHRFYRKEQGEEKLYLDVSISTVQKLTTEVNSNWMAWKKAYYENHLKRFLK